MTNTLLLDLDDTLLQNSMEGFLPAYFKALTRAMSDDVPPEQLLQALHVATRAMMQPSDGGLTNEERFWTHFEPLLPESRAALTPKFTRFYEEVFPRLQPTTHRVAGARELVEAVRAAGWRLVVATNPLFPLIALEERLRWAGLDPADFELITSYEIMHSTKPHASYFAEIAERLAVAPGDCVMAGNHLANDLVGAAAAGMRTFWVTTHGIDDAEIEPDGAGSLDELRRWLLDER